MLVFVIARCGSGCAVAKVLYDTSFCRSDPLWAPHRYLRLDGLFLSFIEPLNGGFSFRSEGRMKFDGGKCAKVGDGISANVAVILVLEPS